MRSFRDIVSNQSKHILVDNSVFPDTMTVMVEEKSEKNQEQKSEAKQLRHLQHLEDLMVIGGHHGVRDTIDALQKTLDYVQGKGRKGFSLSTKFDGYPSIVFGHDPKTKKFFVGTKSFFNKTPKINYTDKDIEANHGNSPGLVEKLKFLRKVLRGVVPSEGIFQADLMYTAGDVSQDGKDISFTPNTLTYHIDKDSYEGRKILRSKVGLAAHTSYMHSKKSDQFDAVFDIDMSKFKPSDDVHFLQTKLRGPFNFNAASFRSVSDNLSRAHKLATTIDFAHIGGHEKLLLGYINDAVRNKKENSVTGYINYLYKQFGKKTEALKQDKSKVKMKDALNAEVKNVLKNKKTYENLFKAHKHIQSAKNVLIGALSKNATYRHSILGNESKPEGFVISVNGKPIKLVDRQHFSAANFDWNAKANPQDNPVVLSWGRFNPPTTGHEKMVKTGAELAKRSGAKHSVVASRTNDKENPLTPAQKLQWLKTMFPGQNTTIAGKDKPTLIAQLQHLHNTGVRDLTMVVGQDRVKDFQHILSRYNGEGAGKLFNFNKVRVISAGDRDADADGTKGMSGHKMRQAAKDHDFKTFRTGVPKHINDKQAKDLFHGLRKSMVKIGAMTSNDALSVYAKKTDKHGKQAQKEIERRQRNGTWSK